MRRRCIITKEERIKKKQEAFDIFIKSDGKINNKDIALRLSVSRDTVRRWSYQDNWQDSLASVKAPATDNSFSIENFLPIQTAKIVNAICESSGAEILWQNILLQYAAIIRAQQLMGVDDDEGILSMESKSAENNDFVAKEWDNHTPWERYKLFLDTQSKAMTSLTQMLKKFDDYIREGLVNEELAAKVKLIKQKAETFNNNNSSVINVVSHIPRANNNK